MNVQTRRPRPAAITLTPAAEQRIANLMAAAPADAIGVKLSTPRRGCSGLAYSVDYVTEANSFDERIESEQLTHGDELGVIPLASHAVRSLHEAWKIITASR